MKGAPRFLLAAALLVGVAAVGLGLFTVRHRSGRALGALEALEAESARAPSPSELAAPHGAPAGERPTLGRDEPATRPVESAAESAAAAREGAAPVFVVYGRALDPQGHRNDPWRPSVWLTDASGVRGSQAGFDEDGYYSLARLEPGPVTLSWSGTGYRTRSERIELSAEQPILRRDLTLERAVTLKVRVATPTGETLYDALRARREAGLPEPEIPFPVATLEAPAKTIEEAAVGGQNEIGVGSFWNYGPPAERAGPGVLGVLLLTVDPPVFVSLVVGVRVIATQRVEPGTEEVAFVFDLEAGLARQAQVRLRVVAGDTGAPLSGMVEDEEGGLYTRIADGAWSATLPPGAHRVRFRSPGYAFLPLEFTLAPGQELDLGEITVPPERTIEGRLLDDQERPVVSRLEVGRRDERGRLVFDETMGFASQADGGYSIFGLFADRYVLRTQGDDEVTFPGRKDPPTVWVSGNVEVSTLGGSVTGLDLHLVKAGVVVLKGVETLPPKSGCRILDEHGDRLRGSRFYPGFVPRFLVPPGAYTLVLVDREGNELERRALAVAEGTNELDLMR